MEDSEIITVTLEDGTFVDPIDPSAFSLTNLPDGVTKGTVTRISDTEVTITLNGNRTTDYDSDITNLQVSVDNSQIVDYTGAVLTANTGVTFTAVDQTVTIVEPLHRATNAFTGSNSTVNGKYYSFRLSTANGRGINNLSFQLKGIHAWRVYAGDLSDFKIYIDLDDDGTPDANEELTADGSGGTINNNSPISVNYINYNGAYYATVEFSNVNLSSSLLNHDIMIQGTVSNIEFNDKWSIRVYDFTVSGSEPGTTGDTIDVSEIDGYGINHIR